MNTFRAIEYHDLYPGIDLLYEGTAEGIKSTFLVAPQADPDNIIIEYYSQSGMTLDSEGNLQIVTGSGLLIVLLLMA